jgi:hypothetical protein
MDVVLRFLAALALAHLLQCLRDTKALHPLFCRSGRRRSVLSPVFLGLDSAVSTELRKILTGLEIACPSGAKPLSCGEVVIGKTLLRVRMNVF